MTVALLFPGQGTQHPGMLPWLEASPAASAMLARLATEFGPDWRARLRDEVWAQSNRTAQLLVTAASVAAWATLAPALPRVVAVAGYSVGELASCVAAGMLDGAAAFELAADRAAAMDACAAASEGGLLAVSGASPGDLAEACARWRLEVAIRTGPDRCVVGGPAADLAPASAWLQARGAKTTLLGVHVASHTGAMRGAVPVLERALAALAWHAPRVAWVAGSRGAVVREPAQVRRSLAEQVATTVRWDECMDTVAERRPDCVLEVGPGTTLARLWRERDPRTPVRSCDDFAGPDDALRWIAQASAA